MKAIRSQLALASCSLLSQHVLGQGVENDWIIDSSFLSYSEADDRAQIYKIVGSVEGNVTNKDNVRVNLVYDTMSGSTPTGLISGDATDTNTSTSADITQTLAEFDDTRLGVDMGWTHQHTRTFNVSYGAAISVENDYQSTGASVNFTKETASRLTSFNAGVAATFDVVSRTGGQTPLPLYNITLPVDEVYVGKGNRHSYDANHTPVDQFIPT